MLVLLKLTCRLKLSTDSTILKFINRNIQGMNVNIWLLNTIKVGITDMVEICAPKYCHFLYRFDLHHEYNTNKNKYNRRQLPAIF